MANKRRIGEIRFASREAYEAGQRDVSQILKMTGGLDLDDPKQADELYRLVMARPYLFETEVGDFFQRFLNGKAQGDVPEECIFFEDLLKDRHSKRLWMRQTFDEEIEEKKASCSQRGIFVTLGIVLSLGVVLFALYRIFSYDIWSYISERKMNALAAEILVPVEAQVSEEHRIADLIASGKYTPEEAKEQVRLEIAAAEEKKLAGSDILYRYSVLYGRNPDMAGWIQIENTVVNYPVMLTPWEEEYYLKKGFDKKYDINGIPFMDVRCSVKEPTTNYLIYGHNMKNGSMFSTLLKYEQQAFYEEHPQIRFDTVYQTGMYEIVGVLRTQVAFQNEDTYRYYQFIQAATREEFDEYITYVKEHSFYETGITATYGDQLLTLSTCDRSLEQGRLVVVGRKIKDRFDDTEMEEENEGIIETRK